MFFRFSLSFLLRSHLQSKFGTIDSIIGESLLTSKSNRFTPLCSSSLRFLLRNSILYSWVSTISCLVIFLSPMHEKNFRNFFSSYEKIFMNLSKNNSSNSCLLLASAFLFAFKTTLNILDPSVFLSSPWISEKLRNQSVLTITKDSNKLSFTSCAVIFDRSVFFLNVLPAFLTIFCSSSFRSLKFLGILFRDKSMLPKRFDLFSSSVFSYPLLPLTLTTLPLGVLN